MRAAELQDPAGIRDSRVHLQAVPNDAGIGEEARAVRIAIGRHYLRVEAAIRLLKRRPLLEDGEPGEARLVDLQHQPLEELGIALQRETVLPLMVGSMPFMAWSHITVCLGHRRLLAIGYWLFHLPATILFVLMLVANSPIASIANSQ